MKFTVILALLAVGCAYGSTNPLKEQVKTTDRDFQIMLTAKNIDVRQDTPLEVVHKANESHLYVIHHTPLFKSPENEEFETMLLERFNTKLYGPVPFNSFFVYASGDVIEFIKSHEKYFDWVSFVDPEWRRDLNLKEPQSVELTEEEQKETKVMTSVLVSLVPTLQHTHEELKSLAWNLQKDMQTFLNHHDIRVEHEEGPRMKVIAKDEEMLIRVADFLIQLPFVQFIEREIHFVPRMKFIKPFVLNGIQVTQSIVDSYYDGSRSGELFTDFVPLTGYNQTIGVADSGLTSPSHCFLYSFVESSGSGVTATNWNGSAVSSVNTLGHPRIKQYYGYQHNTVGDETGHGTYVSTIISANPPTTFSESNQYRGLAYQAKLAIMDLNAPSTQTLSVPSNLQNMYNVAYLAGARTYCNSFSGYDPTKFSGYTPSAGYSTQTRDIDAFMYNNPDMLIVVPAGFVKCVNASSTLGSLGWSKVRNPSILSYVGLTFYQIERNCSWCINER
jgi:hypothetical protein